ncbi:MAG: type III-A CRISPR-associated RAMP protein Csm3 [Spirochaetota bacterium]|nr:type III-A CRISPR-associated RAMP protein Csm3 [Spirochaetota bacterium]
MKKLNKISQITGKIHIITGLHIGSGKDMVEIGGVDNPIIRNPLDGDPYIPGSSLKGKMRSLLELSRENGPNSEGPCNCKDPECSICRVFGNTNPESNVGSTRSIFHDLFLSKESTKMLKEKDILAVEVKSETAIDRLKGTAKTGSLRTTERVIAGLEFDLEISLRIFENDGDSSIELLKDGLKLVKNDALGGSTSRGYGRVEFRDLKIDGKPFSLGAENVEGV